MAAHAAWFVSVVKRFNTDMTDGKPKAFSSFWTTTLDETRATHTFHIHALREKFKYYPMQSMSVLGPCTISLKFYLCGEVAKSKYWIVLVLSTPSFSNLFFFFYLQRSWKKWEEAEKKTGQEREI